MSKTTDRHRSSNAVRTPEIAAARTGLALVARQPIYGPAMAVSAYELLYQEAGDVAQPAADMREATLRIVADAALEIGLDRLAGGLPVHINYPRELLLSDAPLTVHPERVVIEVVEDVPSGPRLVEAIKALRARGHRIALDDYSSQLNDPALLDVVNCVKIDVSQQTRADLERTAGDLTRRGLMLIALEVETIEQFEHCLQIGFEGFQGDFLHRPETFEAQRVPSSRVATLRLIATLQNSDCSMQAIESLVSQDLPLSYRVLRCINSSYYNLPRKVDSIRQAIVMLGLDNLRQLATLIALHGFDNRPTSLFVTAMTRARLCEQLARLAGVEEAGPYFITGLFSLLDVLTGISIANLLDELPLSESIEHALLGQEGDLGAALRCARAYERASWGRVTFRGLSPELIRAAYVDAVFWAEQTQALTAA
ncbi:MAG TPA: HDOD domain-containing protein [Steroidobacteraceae bacterium]|nr:HDOD domain-containing protein [Steroidobacteraceae bacterium]